MATYRATVLCEVVRPKDSFKCDDVNCRACDNSEVLTIYATPKHKRYSKEKIINYLKGVARRKLADRLKVGIIRIKVHEVELLEVTD